MSRRAKVYLVAIVVATAGVTWSLVRLLSEPEVAPAVTNDTPAPVETAHITAIDARKPVPATGEPIVRWRVVFQDQNGARGHVDVDTEGRVLEAAQPETADR